ncbi:hypothetical protein GCM10016455_05760 [Aliiroseovarius zhejiangensis]|uniref:Uncharacterized protein n=1 Tax=Aliiroseovarius zhejiangensis TaxID=1632025 RepID=A0ABQ3ISB3_9RHOB|nr:hypothetical protein [Aliiroseovarius zhejiangensis]GHE88477.1 hypothetical protein GCM10016455_05760 [Aliiroseovarius zhejiangensis]
MIDVLDILGTSDAASGDWYATLTTDISHFALGVICAGLVWRFPALFKLALVALGAWIGKEVFADLSSAGFTRAAIADTVKDLSLGLAGYVLVWAVIVAVRRRAQ